MRCDMRRVGGRVKKKEERTDFPEDGGGGRLRWHERARPPNSTGCSRVERSWVASPVGGGILAPDMRRHRECGRTRPGGT